MELHLAVEAKKKLSEYIESKSLPVEVKENFAIVNSKYGSLAEASTHFHVEITSTSLSGNFGYFLSVPSIYESLAICMFWVNSQAIPGINRGPLRALSYSEGGN